ncbi:MAG: hypothetical protein Fur0043_02020 [Anaerolineales bacterium]
MQASSAIVMQRLSRLLRIVFVHLCLTALGGLVVLGLLLSEPSQDGGLLGFSLGRWAALLVHSLALAGVLFVLYRVWTNRAGRLEAWLASEQHLFWLVFLAIGLFAASLSAALGLLPFIRRFAYFGRLQPSLLWLAFASGQVTLTLLVVLRRSILSWFRQFFPLDAALQVAPLTRPQRLLMGGLTLSYLALQLASHLQVRQAAWLPDSIDYIFPATTYSWTEAGLWMHTKPWGAAVLYKLIGSSPGVIDAAQTALSALAWLALAWAFGRFLRAGWLRVAAFGLLLGFSLSPSVQMWNHVIQSESLSISLMAAILAVWMTLLKRFRWHILFLLLFLLAWWIGTRETNVYLGLIVAATLVIAGLFFKRQRFYWAVSVLVICFCVLNLNISEIPTLPRWLYPLTNTILHRILPEQEFVQYFEAHGMPVTPELLALSGGYADSGGFAVFNNSALDEMERWLYKHGKDVYFRFLLDHPAYTLLSPWQNLDALLSPRDLRSYAPPQYDPPLAWLFGSLLFPDSLWLVALLILAALVSGYWGQIWHRGPLAWLIIGFLALFLPHFYLIWHGDAAEVGRHAIQASVQVRLGLWLMVLFGLSSAFHPAQTYLVARLSSRNPNGDTNPRSGTMCRT